MTDFKFETGPNLTDLLRTLGAVSSFFVGAWFVAHYVFHR